MPANATVDTRVTIQLTPRAALQLYPEVITCDSVASRAAKPCTATEMEPLGVRRIEIRTESSAVLELERMQIAPHRTHPFWSLGAKLERLMLQACLSLADRSSHAGQDKVS